MTAHAYSAEAIAVAVANGVRSIEHGNLLDAPTAAPVARIQAPPGADVLEPVDVAAQGERQPQLTRVSEVRVTGPLGNGRAQGAARSPCRHRRKELP